MIVIVTTRRSNIPRIPRAEVSNPVPGELPSCRVQLQPLSNTPEPAIKVFRFTWAGLELKSLSRRWLGENYLLNLSDSPKTFTNILSSDAPIPIPVSDTALEYLWSYSLKCQQPIPRSVYSTVLVTKKKHRQQSKLRAEWIYQRRFSMK